MTGALATTKEEASAPALFDQMAANLVSDLTQIAPGISPDLTQIAGQIVAQIEKGPAFRPGLSSSWLVDDGGGNV
jgi:hypothetical protein